MASWRKRLKSFFKNPGRDGAEECSPAKPARTGRKAPACKPGEVRITFSGQAYLLKNGTTSLEVAFQSGAETNIDKLFLQIENQRFQPLDWKPLKVKKSHRQFNLFDLRQILNSVQENSLKRAAFIAVSGGEEYGSPLFDISTLIM